MIPLLHEIELINNIKHNSDRNLNPLKASMKIRETTVNTCLLALGQ